MKATPVLSWACSLLAIAAAACGADSSTGDATTASASSRVGQWVTTSSATSTSGTGGAGGSGGQGGSGGGEYVPTPEDIQFQAVNPVPAGEQILFNDWNTFPNGVWSMAPDGSGAIEIFRAYRIWSMGVAHAGDGVRLGDPLRSGHYGVTIGDAIQHTFLYDFSSESVDVTAYGNLNDECHSFGPGDTSLFVCRRYDFVDGDFARGYRIGRIDLPSEEFTFLVPESDELTLYPQTVDGIDLYYGSVVVGPSGSNQIMRMTLPDGVPELVRETARSPVLSADGTSFLFNDNQNQGALTLATIGGAAEVVVADVAASGARFSPDGTQVAYMIWDDTVACSHVDVVAADGSEASTPTRIRDCNVTGEFITEIVWFSRP